MFVKSTRYLIITLMLVALVSAAGCTSAKDEPASEPAAPIETPTVQSFPAPGVVADVTELQIEDLALGTGTEATTGTVVTVHYTGWLTDGTKFDSSVDSGQPFEFTLGAGYVIPGWDVGVAGMKVGGYRRLTIPSDMGYGAAGAGGVIPPNATLVFDVELLAVN